MQRASGRLSFLVQRCIALALELELEGMTASLYNGASLSPSNCHRRLRLRPSKAIYTLILEKPAEK